MQWRLLFRIGPLSKFCTFLFFASPSVLWYCWLGLLTCKNHLPYNLYCVGGDVKHCSINQLFIFVMCTYFKQTYCKHDNASFCTTKLCISNITFRSVIVMKYHFWHTLLNSRIVSSIHRRLFVFLQYIWLLMEYQVKQLVLSYIFMSSQWCGN